MADLFQFRQQDDITLIPEPRRKHGTLPMAREGCQCDPCVDALLRERSRHQNTRPAMAQMTKLVREEPWMADARCKGMNPEWWHPLKGEPVDEQKAVCKACPVRSDCLEYAMYYHLGHGIWGGTSERERRVIRKERRRAAA